MRVVFGEPRHGEVEIHEQHSAELGPVSSVTNVGGGGRRDEADEETDRNRGPHVIGAEGAGLPPASLDDDLPGSLGTGRTLEARHLPAEQELRAARARGGCVGLGDLPVASPRIVEVPKADRFDARHSREHFAGELGERASRHPAPRLRRREGVGLPTPDLPGVRKVEVVTNRAPQVRPEDGGERVIAGGPRGEPADHNIPCHPQREAAI